MPGRMTLDGLVKAASQTRSVKDSVVDSLGEGAIPILDSMEKVAEQKGVSLYDQYDADTLCSLVERVAEKTSNKTASDRGSNMGVKVATADSGSDVRVAVAGQDDEVFVKIAEAQAMGQAMGEAQALAFYDTMQKLASLQDEDSGLYGLEDLDDNLLDDLAAHHANDLLVFTGHVSPEKVAAAEQLEEQRVPVMEMPLNDAVMHEIGARAYVKLAEVYGEEGAAQVESEIQEIVNSLY